MFIEQYNIALIRNSLDAVFYGDYENRNYIEPDPYAVTIERCGDRVIVKSCAFLKEIEMKDTLWMKLNGQTWEGKVSRAQTDAFQAAYIYIKDTENLDYQVNRLK